MYAVPFASSYLCRQTLAFGVYPANHADGVEQMTLQEIGHEKQVVQHCSAQGVLRLAAGIHESVRPAWVPPLPVPHGGSEGGGADCRFDGL